jgi:Glyoxalase-like domain
MVTRLDHLISVVQRDELDDFAERLYRAGFVRGDAGRHLGLGTANVNLAFAGGAFLELCYEESPGASGLSWWQNAPRIFGVVMNSDDYDDDARAWADLDGAWEQHMDKELEDDTRVHLHASGPFPRNGFDPILIDRPQPPFVGRPAEARLLQLTLRGASSDTWRQRLIDYFGLPGEDTTLRLGDVEIQIERGAEDPIELSATFAVPREKGTIPLHFGELELV